MPLADQDSSIQSSARVIAVDGPGGSGKGTVSLAVASRLDWHYLDSGATYRVLAYLADKHHVSLENIPELVRFVQNLDLEFRNGAAWLDGAEVGDIIRTEEAGKHASLVATVPEVRETLLNWQRSQARAPGLVADGRDMGTVVFPQAVCKFFITASAEVRAERRFKQLRKKGFYVNIHQLIKDISERDARDMNRSVSPLRPAEDAVLVDTTDLNTDEVICRVMAEISNRIF